MFIFESVDCATEDSASAPLSCVVRRHVFLTDGHPDMSKSGIDMPHTGYLRSTPAT